MNFSELKTELGDRGFRNLLSDTRLGQYINRAKDRLDNMYRWPYREASGVGTAPLIVADLGQVEAVNNQTDHFPLYEASYIDLNGWFGDLTTTGTPYYWYRAFPSGSPVIATYPVDTTKTIGVQYWKVTPTLTGTNTPLAPSRFHLLYVDMAVQMAYRDSDNHAMAESLQVEINRQILEMIEDLLPQQGPNYQETSWHGSEDW